MEKIFAKGFSVKRRDTAPDFHICRLSCKVDDAIQFLSEHSKAGYVNINVTKAKSGSFYCELDTYEPKQKFEYKPQSPKKEAVEEEPKDQSGIPDFFRKR